MATDESKAPIASRTHGGTIAQMRAPQERNNISPGRKSWVGWLYES